MDRITLAMVRPVNPRRRAVSPDEAPWETKYYWTCQWPRCMEYLITYDWVYQTPQFGDALPAYRNYCCLDHSTADWATWFEVCAEIGMQSLEVTSESSTSSTETDEEAAGRRGRSGPGSTGPRKRSIVHVSGLRLMAQVRPPVITPEHIDIYIYIYIHIHIYVYIYIHIHLYTVHTYIHIYT
jgi:hypothetical protein